MVQMQGFCILVILCVGGAIEVRILGQELPRYYSYNYPPSPLLHGCTTILILMHSMQAISPKHYFHIFYVNDWAYFYLFFINVTINGKIFMAIFIV
jgi:hypothetical protein